MNVAVAASLLLVAGCGAATNSPDGHPPDAGPSDAAADARSPDATIAGDAPPVDAWSCATPQPVTAIATKHAIATRGQSWLRVYADRGTGFELFYEANALGHFSQVAWGDGNGDGTDELASSWFDLDDGHQIRILGDRGAGFQELQILSGANPSFAWFDRDGDAYRDLWAARSPGAVYCGSATDLALCWSFVAVEQEAQEIVTADFDRDGDEDVAVRSGVDVRIYRNAGGQFALVYQVTDALGSSSAVDLDWVELDGCDGPELAVVTGDFGAPPFHWSVVHWDGAMFTAVDQPGPIDTRGVAWADFDEDGDADPLICKADGLGALYRRSETTYELVASYDGGCDGAWADFDGDGDPDFAYESLADGALVILRDDAGVLVEAERIIDTSGFIGLAWGRCGPTSASDCFPDPS